MPYYFWGFDWTYILVILAFLPFPAGTGKHEPHFSEIQSGAELFRAYRCGDRGADPAERGNAALDCSISAEISTITTIPGQRF